MTVYPTKTRRLGPSMMAITLLAGVTGFVYQFMPDGAMLTFLVTTAALGGLVGSSKTFDERDQQLLWQSYAQAFEILFWCIFSAYTLVMLASWLHIASGVITFVNAHWISMLASSMCIILGGAGLRNFRDAG